MPLGQEEPQYPADLHSVGCLLHLLPESVGFGARGLQVAGQPRGLHRLLPPAGGTGTVSAAATSQRPCRATAGAKQQETIPVQLGFSTHCQPQPCPSPQHCTHRAPGKESLPAGYGAMSRWEERGRGWESLDMMLGGNCGHLSDLSQDMLEWGLDNSTVPWDNPKSSQLPWVPLQGQEHPALCIRAHQDGKKYKITLLKEKNLHFCCRGQARKICGFCRQEQKSWLIAELDSRPTETQPGLLVPSELQCQGPRSCSPGSYPQLGNVHFS